MTSKRPDSADGSRQTAGPLDELDRAIVEMLRADGRRSVRSLAEALSISRATAYARLARLERDGVITGYAATVDAEKYGYGISAYVYLRISQHSWKAVRRRVEQIDAVWHAALVSGENDLVLLVRTHDASALRELVLTELQTMPDVVSTQTVLILDEVR